MRTCPAFAAIHAATATFMSAGIATVLSFATCLEPADAAHPSWAFSWALFGAGLALSGMIDPARVLGFLDVAGRLGSDACLRAGRRAAPSSIAYALVRG